MSEDCMKSKNSEFPILEFLRNSKNLEFRFCGILFGIPWMSSGCYPSFWKNTVTTLPGVNSQNWNSQNSEFPKNWNSPNSRKAANDRKWPENPEIRNLEFQKNWNSRILSPPINWNPMDFNLSGVTEFQEFLVGIQSPEVQKVSELDESEESDLLWSRNPYITSVGLTWSRYTVPRICASVVEMINI